MLKVDEKALKKLKRNEDWHYANLDFPLSKYNDNYIDISDCSVVGVFNNFSGDSVA